MRGSEKFIIFILSLGILTCFFCFSGEARNRNREITNNIVKLDPLQSPEEIVGPIDMEAEEAFTKAENVRFNYIMNEIFSGESFDFQILTEKEHEEYMEGESVYPPRFREGNGENSYSESFETSVENLKSGYWLFFLLKEGPLPDD